MMRQVYMLSLLLFLLMAGVADAAAQARQKFSVVSFALDPFDTAAQDDKYRKEDGDGEPYAIIKVSSDNPDDNIEEYMFDFGNMYHLQQGVHGQEQWLYVQRNAKHVTISRKGYATISRYGLNTVVEKGRTYRLRLSSTRPVVYKQMVLFTVKPADAKAVVMVARDGEDRESMLGVVDEQGQLASSLEYGRYSYRVLAKGYDDCQGAITLDNEGKTLEETVQLYSQLSTVKLSVDADADIYVDNQLKGNRTWSGQLTPGQYKVECRQQNHRPTLQTIVVEKNRPVTVTLPSPEPITGKLSLMSQPLGATIQIDGVNYEKTPRIVPDLLIGSHTLLILREGYKSESRTVTIKEGETVELNLKLEPVKDGNATAMTTTPALQGNNATATPVSSGNDTIFTVNGVSFVMKAVQGGTFKMGAKNKYDKPIHQVTLSDYMIGETEVTQALWKAVMGSNPSYFTGDKRPVEQVSWYDCQNFIEKLNSLTGQRFRLPTEAEWEYAARGGNKSHGYQYSGSKKLSDVAWYTDSEGETHDVKTKQANELGIYDMSGNVWEWCQDWYGSYSSSAQINPLGPSSGSVRVLRGGGWSFIARQCRVTFRFRFAPDYRNYYHGLRLAL